MNMTMHLYHGRKTPTEDMNDWGSVGPALAVDLVTVTYREDIQVRFTGMEDVEPLTRYMADDLFFYDGIFYGDLSFQDASDIDVDAELIDLSKTLLPVTT